jgi:hypothetical protein
MVRQLSIFNFYFHFVAEIRYTTPAPSSDTSSEPSGATVTPTGRPVGRREVEAPEFRHGEGESNADFILL